MILLINTASDLARVALLFEEEQYCLEKVFPLSEKLSEVLLEYIDSLLTAGKYQREDVSGVLCVRGPGHFTSIRIGVITANTIAFALSVSIVGVLIGKENEGFEKLIQGESDRVVVPEYDMAPDIGKKKK